jgi:flagellar motor protein MotB
MNDFLHLRRLFAGLLAILLLAATAAAAQTQTPLPLQPEVPGTGTNHRLILKDGTYQLVRKYEIAGDRVRYISVERGGDWEELPADLVDWEATRKWERDHADQPVEAPSAAMKEAEAIDKEEAAERDEQKARMPEVAKGLQLPDEDGVFAMDTFQGTPELVELLPTELNANAKTKHGLSTLNPLAGAKASLELEGAHAKVHLHVNDPAIYLSLNARDDAEQVVSHAMTVDTGGAKEVASRKHGAHSPASGFAIVRVDERRALRIVGAVHMSVTGAVTQDENVIPAKVEVLPGKHWLKIAPEKPLTIGEYALVEILSASDINQSVWDFRVDPQLGDNPGSLGPILK